MRNIARRCLQLLLPALLLPSVTSAAPPLADVHVHYKWNQRDVTSPEQALAALRAADISLAVVIGTPPEYALELRQLAPEHILAIWSPYRNPGDWSRWAFDSKVLGRARLALESGHYAGIGELHLIGGFAPSPDSPVISGLAEMAAEFKVPVLVHTEFSKPDYMLALCSRHPETRFVWAHAGALLTAEQVQSVLQGCPLVWAELSARDPWRFVNNPVTGSDGRLLPAWRTLVEAYPTRFMVGSDPVWPVEKLDGWDQDDTGWEHYPRFVEFHRGWLQHLPDDLRRRVEIENARQLFTP